MIKRIKDLTTADKARYINNIKVELERTGMSWDFYVSKIQEEISNTFNDEKFSKMPSEFAIDAAYAREYFGWSTNHKIPSFEDYIIWMGYFVTKSDLVEIGDL